MLDAEYIDYSDPGRPGTYTKSSRSDFQHGIGRLLEFGVRSVLHGDLSRKSRRQPFLLREFPHEVSLGNGDEGVW